MDFEQMWIHYIIVYTMVYTQLMHHGGRVMHTWNCICRAILGVDHCGTKRKKKFRSEGH